MKQLFVLIFLLVLSVNSLSAQQALPGDSIYQLQSEWTTQNNTKLHLKELSGKTQIVSMIYTHCLHTCPTIVATMQALERKIPEAQRRKYGFVLVSLTPESDTPAVLKEFAKSRKLDEKRWTLLTAKSGDVRNLAMALNVQYKNMEDNEVAHSNVYTILDEQGRFIFQEIGDISKVDSVIERMKIN